MTDAYLPLALILVAALVTGWSSFRFKGLARFGKRQRVRASGAALRETLSRSIELGDAAHLDLNGGGVGMSSAAAFAGLKSANRIARRAAFDDVPPVFSSDDGIGGELLERTVDQGYRSVDMEAGYEPTTVRSAGIDPVAHQGVMLTALDETHEPLHLSIGSAGSEIALQDLAFESSENVLIAGDNLAAQAAGLVSAEEIFVGEQVYSLPTLLRTEELKSDSERAFGTIASLKAIDRLRWLFLAGLLAAAVWRLIFG